MNSTWGKSITSVGLLILTASVTHGQVLFSDNFDAGTSAATWTPRLSHADASANFAFDYSTLGIPSAPNSSGTTIGMRFLANQTAAIQQGVSASPNGQSFTGNFRVTFDMWLNHVGPLTAGGSGSTQVGSFGWGTSGAAAQWAGSSSSIMFGATSDGGSTFDYRVYRNNALQGAADGVYAATGSAIDVRNNTHAYYTSRFGGESAPAAQLALYPGQTETTAAGALGFDWRAVEIEKNGDILTWTVDDQLLATVSAATATLSGDNIFFGIFDINGTSSADVNDFLNTAIYDNVQVSLIPEPTTAAFALLGGAGLLLMRRRK